MKAVNKLESSQAVLYKWKNEHSIRLIENESLMKDIQNNLEQKVETVVSDYIDT